MKVSAVFVLRLVGGVLVAAASVMWGWSWHALTADQGLPGSVRGVLAVAGLLMLVAGLLGPARVLRCGMTLPPEIRRMLTALATVLPLVGLVWLGCRWSAAPRGDAWALFIAGFGFVWLAVEGLYPLSRALPTPFSVAEFVSIVRSAGLAGDKARSAMDIAFQRWTQGRDGVAAGAIAPDGPVIKLDATEVQLSSYWAAGPLVVNFGSYSCPHHRKRLAELEALRAVWQPRGIAFLTVYTAEAHAEDGWKLPGQYRNDAEYTDENAFCFPYAKDLAARRAMAVWLVEKKHFVMPVVLDRMDDGLLRAYNSWPIRLYVIAGGRIVYCGDQGPFGYQPAELTRVLQDVIVG